MAVRCGVDRTEKAGSAGAEEGFPGETPGAPGSDSKLKEGVTMELWTQAHGRTLLPAIVVMALIAAILRLTLGKKPLKIRMIPFQILACLLVVLEIGKQVLSLREGYDLYHLPFHFCSMFIFLPPLMAFYRGKFARTVSCITAATTGALFLLMVIYPNLIYSADNIKNFFTGFFDFHTVAFHNVAMMEFVLILALDLHAPAPKGETKKVLLFILGFCTVSASMAHLLKTNFNNFYTCNIAPLETVRLSVEMALGTTAAAIFYVLIVTALDLLFVSGTYWLYRLLRRLITKKSKIEV